MCRPRSTRGSGAARVSEPHVCRSQPTHECRSSLDQHMTSVGATLLIPVKGEDCGPRWTEPRDCLTVAAGLPEACLSVAE